MHSSDIDFAAQMNLVIAAVFFLAFALFRITASEEAYFPKWFVKGPQTRLRRQDFVPERFSGGNFLRAYLSSLNWIPAVWRVPEKTLIDHAGLDSVVFLRIYKTGLKILVPICVIVFAIIVPVNYTNDTVFVETNESVSGMDKLSIQNIATGSKRFRAHIFVAYVITFWTCFVLRMEYGKIATMRMDFIAADRQRPSRYTALVRNVPSDSGENLTVSEHVEQFFKDIYPDQYLSHKLVYKARKLTNLINEKEESRNRLDKYQKKYEKNNKRPSTKKGGKKEDAIDFYTSKIERLNNKITEERAKIIEKSSKLKKYPDETTAFVFFKSGRGAAACAQSQQTRHPNVWSSEWAPEPNDVCWENLSYTYISLPARKLWVVIIFVAIISLSTLVTAFILSYLSLEGLESVIPGFHPTGVLRSFIESVLPQIPLKMFHKILEYGMEGMTKLLSLSSKSASARRNASGAYIMLFINSFILILVPASSYKEIINYFFKSQITMVEDISMNLPVNDSFFIVYIILGVTEVAREILRWKPFRRFYVNNLFWNRTRTEPDSLGLDQQEPEIQLYLLLALVFAVVSPLLLVAVIIFFALSWVVYRNQVINVYDQEFESAAAFWPDVHGRIIVSLLASQLLLLGFLNNQQAYQAIPLLLLLSGFTVAFYKYCKARFEPLFRTYPMLEALNNDKLDEEAEEPIIDLKDYLINAYTNPVFIDEEEEPEPEPEAEAEAVDVVISVAEGVAEPEPEGEALDEPEPEPEPEGEDEGDLEAGRHQPPPSQP